MKPRILKVDVCARPYLIAKIFIILLKCKTFNGCRVDPSCAIEAMLQLILTYVCCFLREDANWGREEEVCIYARVYVNIMEAMKEQKLLHVRKVL